MQKILRKLLVGIIAVAAVCFACFAAACGNGNGGNGGSGDNSGSSNNYIVVVKYSDGTPVNGQTDGNGYNSETETSTLIRVQWCGSGADASCATPVVLGTDGTYTVSASTLKNYGASPYHVKLLGVKTDEYDVDLVDILGNDEDPYAGYEVTSPTTITVTLTSKTAN